MLKKFIAVALLTVSGQVMAHGSGVAGAGFGAGLAHPLSGLDHLLAALAVGLLASRDAGAVRWRLPVLFTLAVALGVALAGQFGAHIFEGAILASLFAFALLLMAGQRSASVPLLMLCVTVFALFHGAAHGTEAPAGAGGVYLAGLLLATFSLHLVGLLLGRRMSGALLRLGGVGLGGTALVLALA